MMDPSEADKRESEWIDGARKADQKAFRSLYELQVDPLFRFLSQFSTDREETQEWVQRAFIRAFERIDQFDGRSRFSTWLFTIGLNEMRADRRKLKLVEFGPNMPDPAVSREDSIDAFEWGSMMKQWLDRLDVQRRSVFILHEVEGFSHTEIAGMLDISESHSRTILTRVRYYLKDQWTKERRAL